ncbi:MAG: DOPA 4,5-dioxygenase family protein [Bacteriovorax sp.]|nr:DOPA 4,5-dioxygenase family protein [Bacteriovorax sp.]
MEENFKVNSKLLPTGFLREFDAHIYFTEDKLAEATLLRDKIKDYFKDSVFFVGEMIPVLIGPHTQPMFEANFPKDMFMEVSLWLMDNRGEFSVLIHSLSGDDLADHTIGAKWLGAEVKLDYSKF